MKIFLLLDDKEAGPFTKAEIFLKLKDGECTQQSPARLESESQWIPLENILNSRTTSFFSVEQLDQIQAELPDAPLVPELSAAPPREKKNDSKPTLKIWALPLLLLAISAVYLLQNDSSQPALTQDAQVSTVEESPSPQTNQQVVIHSAPIESEKTITQSSTKQNEPTPKPEAIAVAIAEPPAVAPQATATPSVTKPDEAPSNPEVTALTKVDSVAMAEADSPPKAATTPLSEKSAPVATPQQAPKIAKQPSNTKSVKDFFKISSVRVLTKEPKDTIGVWKITYDKESRPEKYEFEQSLEVKASTALNTISDKLKARAYFFNEKNALVEKALEPTPSGKKTDRTFTKLPVYFREEKAGTFFFKVPESLRDTKWKAVVVFGDRHELQSACYPPTESDFMLSYPEREFVYDRTRVRVERRPAIDPLVEHKVKTRNPKMPEFTLFLRPPPGIYDASEVEGVLAICYLANSVDELRTQLQRVELSGDYDGLFAFAKKHKLAVIAWAAKRLWSPTQNYDQLTREEAKEVDKGFDFVANAWERGVNELAEKYGIPKNNYLLWGSCGSAQWAHRLCLRKPDYFLAIDIHLPGSFDKPTQEASKVLWCLTTGELYGGYQRANNFIKECRELGYPILYKPIVGLGHAGHPDASALGLKFLEFALTQKEARTKYDFKRLSGLDIGSKENKPKERTWLEAFNSPPFYGDFVNQELYTASEVSLIPEGYRTPIPTKELAAIWARSK